MQHARDELADLRDVVFHHGLPDAPLERRLRIAFEIVAPAPLDRLQQQRDLEVIEMVAGRTHLYNQTRMVDSRRSTLTGLER